MSINHLVKIGIAISTPIPFVRGPNGQQRKERTSLEWHRARMGLGSPTNIILAEIVTDGMEVGAARNTAAQRALEHPSKPEFLFFLDYDVITPYDALTKLLYRARCYPEFDIFAGVYCSKGGSSEPLIYATDGVGPNWDWAVGDLLFDMSSVHMGLTLIRTSLFEKMEGTEDNPWFVTVNDRGIVDGRFVTNRGTEDIYFCKRAREEVKARIMVDTSVLAAHQDLESGTLYGLPPDSPPILRAKGWMKIPGDVAKKDEETGKYSCPICEGPTAPRAPHGLEGTEDIYVCSKLGCNWRGPSEREGLIAIDIGAGAERRHWDNHRTYTLDIRSEVGADYVQDTRFLNLPDEHFDLVASSHHLEHIGRADQIRVWSEMYRILKTGGRMEHIVPNVQWAASHIMDGHMDEHVMNVLYGAQEEHGYARDLNTHYFAYTPETALAMAESCGLSDIEIITYKSEGQAALGYNLIIKGVKKETETETETETEPETETKPEVTSDLNSAKAPKKDLVE